MGHSNGWSSGDKSDNLGSRRTLSELIKVDVVIKDTASSSTLSTFRSLSSPTR